MFVDAAIAEEEQEQEQATATKSRLRRNLLVHSKQASDQASDQECRSHSSSGAASSAQQKNGLAPAAEREKLHRPKKKGKN
jgi:hypothetical protein